MQQDAWPLSFCEAKNAPPRRRFFSFRLAALICFFACTAAAVEPAKAYLLDRPITDRDAWSQASKIPVSQDAVAQAEKALEQPLPVVKNEDYLSTFQTLPMDRAFRTSTSVTCSRMKLFV